MKKWPFKVEYYTADEVEMFCVHNAKWQAFRVKLKGLPTEQKLDCLYSWKENGDGRVTKVQIDNYINALKRGGQLGMDLTVRR